MKPIDLSTLLEDINVLAEKAEVTPSGEPLKQFYMCALEDAVTLYGLLTTVEQAPASAKTYLEKRKQRYIREYFINKQRETDIQNTIRQTNSELGKGRY